jgi:glycosyltransferase involved in cell wall biosynthesis
MIKTSNKERLRIIHLISGDRWAGAEVQVFTLLKELSKNYDVFAIVLNQGELVRRLKELDVPVTIYDETQVSSWKIFIGICRTLKLIKPDVVHTHRQKENILGSIANQLIIRAKCIRTVHGDSEFIPTGIARLQFFLDKFCGRYLQQAVIAVSEDLRQKLMEKLPANKIVTIVNGIDPEETRLNLKYPDFKLTMPDKKHIGFVGRLDPVKRVDLFLEMAFLLQKEHPEIPWHFHIFGEGKLKAEMLSLSSQLGISNSVIFHCHRMDINNCILGLDAAVLCSDHEGLPMIALECLAIGTPLIAHNVGGLSQLMRTTPEQLVLQHNAPGYSKAVYKFIANKKTNAPYPENHTIKNTANHIVDLYTSILAATKNQNLKNR